MTVATTSMSLLVKVQPAPAAEETPRAAAVCDDAEARRLATGIARGDEAVFREFYGRYEGRLFRLALVLSGGDETAAQDAVQSTFIIAAQKLRGIDSAAHLWNWLARVARQQVSKTWKQSRRHPSIVDMAELPDSIGDEADMALENLLDTALQAMEANEREALEWFYFDRLSHQEIAERLQSTPKAVSSRLERARAKLRAALLTKLSHET